MSKLLVVFGATGNQGGSVVDYVLKDPTLSKEFTVRAVTRDPSSSSSQSLKQAGAQVVKGDLDDVESINSALKGAHTVFLATISVYDDQLKAREVRQGKTVADEAVAAGAQYIIFSTLVHTRNVTGGNLKNMDHFDGKAEIEAHIRSLPIKSAFFAPGSFMQNYSTMMKPQPLGDGTYALFNFVTPETKLPLIETAADCGKWVGAAMAEPEKYNGKVFWASTYLRSFAETAEIMSRATGKTVVYKQLPRDTYAGFMAPSMAGPICDMFEWVQDYGYYGPETDEKVEWAAMQARGKLTTLEEYLEKNPLNLE